MLFVGYYLAMNENVQADKPPMTPQQASEELWWKMIDRDSNINLKAIQLLLDAGADVNYRGESSQFERSVLKRHTGGILHSAVFRKNLEILHLLLDAGANIEAGDDELSTPLFWSVNLGESASTQTLLAAGAFIDNDILWADEPNIKDRHKKATKMWSDWQETQNITGLTAQDITLFANIGHLNEVIHPSIWRGHEEHLGEVISGLSEPMRNRILNNNPALIQMISEPEFVVRGFDVSIDRLQSSQKEIS